MDSIVVSEEIGANPGSTSNLHNLVTSCHASAQSAALALRSLPKCAHPSRETLENGEYRDSILVLLTQNSLQNIFDALHTYPESALHRQLGNSHYRVLLVQNEGINYVEGEAQVQDAASGGIPGLGKIYVDIEG